MEQQDWMKIYIGEARDVDGPEQASSRRRAAGTEKYDERCD